MGLLDEAQGESKIARGPRCSVSLLDDELIAEIDEALAAVSPGSITIAGVARALANRGVEIKAHTLSRHRAGECSCEPS